VTSSPDHNRGIQVSQPTPLPSASKPCGLGGRRVKLLPVICPQFRSGGGGGIQKSGTPDRNSVTVESLWSEVYELFRSGEPHRYPELREEML
jgi:hypothetical protein